ncbi:site-specific DNA-methyltransferase [Mucilaginibacter sp.]|uniref:DNA-methyltransferase n=1 Tax=Mucilaginibacter sp. TaxID=1882438 RepID=UPI002625168B|nr:site-specific DNA-methyltransferase [Mucilaginibacter sp.]MDB4919829.1 methylase domain protein [Mucilaginibacter sp.]
MNCIDGLRLLLPKSINTCVSSPPYYALRDYGIEPTKFPAIEYTLFGFTIKVKAMTVCLGLEPTPEDFIGHMVYIYRLVREALKDDGTIWVNIGDSYSATAKSRNDEQAARKSKLMGSKGTQISCAKQQSKIFTGTGIKPKDMIGIPWMLAFALRADGWYLRQDIIWHKKNCMPESCNDRCTKNHEYIFLLSKKNRYYFDQEAIATEVAPSTARDARVINDMYSTNRPDQGFVGSPSQGKGMLKPKYKVPNGWDSRAGSHNVIDWATEEAQGRGNPASYKGSSFDKGKTGEVLQTRGGRSPRPDDSRGGNQGNGDIPAIGKGNRKTFRGGGTYVHDQAFENSAAVANNSVGNTPNETGKANKRSVWTIATQGFKEAHFATFPEKLIEDCIKAGCPPDGLVLDHFMGSGTTALVSSKLGRNFIGFEQNPKYLEIANNRLFKELGLFNPISNAL